MADRYIDYLEVGEYGDHFVTECQRLIGAHGAIDMAVVSGMVAEAVGRVDTELLTVGIRRSEARQTSTSGDTVTTRARRSLDYFWTYLAQLDEDVSVDIGVFFPGGRKGPLAALKPADLLARLGEVLRGFEVPAHADLPEAESWKARLTADREALRDLVRGAHTARADAIVATAGLVAAREHFLHIYNRVAKPATRALLALLGRERDYRLYFKDLQVNEPRPARAPAPEPEPTA